MHKMSKQTTALKPVYPIHQQLKISWWCWLAYRLFAVAVLSHLLLSKQPSIIGGITWQGLWLIPAFCSTPFIIKGKKPYPLLIISLLMFIYIGGSGMIIFQHILTQNWSLFFIWLIDFVLLGLINYWLFILLKRLPKMNS